ncbi:hypothetical protein GQ54DRAFT_328380 [Martensiomyces pterosporus]|nr:hypothetical protein GQ54DRAFT_328380 [Martensiomyces pterosporus]
MSRAVYFFRNIRTKQVLASTEKTLLSKTRLINAQIPDVTLRPTVVRPDHWTPLVVASGFETEEAQRDAFMLMSKPGHPLVPQTDAQKKKYTLMMNKNKRLADMDTIERQVAQLARSLVYMDATKASAIPGNGEGKVKLLWENNEWIRKVEDAGLTWPRWIEHGSLDLKRGNIITNKELRGSAA